MTGGEFWAVVERYTARFGITFTTMGLPASRFADLAAEMERALADERGPLTDDEVHGDVPEDADL